MFPFHPSPKESLILIVRLIDVLGLGFGPGGVGVGGVGVGGVGVGGVGVGFGKTLGGKLTCHISI
jgi:hypothetical protein